MTMIIPINLELKRNESKLSHWSRKQNILRTDQLLKLRIKKIPNTIEDSVQASVQMGEEEKSHSLTKIKMK